MPKKWKAARILFYSFYEKCDNHLKGSCHRPQDPEHLRTVTINRGQSYPLGVWDSGWHKWQLLCSRKWAWCWAHATHTAPRSPRREVYNHLSLDDEKVNSPHGAAICPPPYTANRQSQKENLSPDCFRACSSPDLCYEWPWGRLQM